MLIKSSFCKIQLCLLYLVLCSLIPEADLCWAGTAVLQKKDEVKYALPRDAIPAIKNPEFVPADEAGLTPLSRGIQFSLFVVHRGSCEIEARRKKLQVKEFACRALSAS